MRLTLPLCLCLLGGCSDFPQVDAAVSAAEIPDTVPRILPLDGVAMSADEDSSADARRAARSLAGRAAALKRRARTLGGPVLTGAERRRLLAAIKRHQN